MGQKKLNSDTSKTQAVKDREALHLLITVVTLGRNNMPYKKLLPRLKAALAESPAVHDGMLWGLSKLPPND